MNNFLLPWLALTAQLPFETETHAQGVMSWFLAVSSPALITYSLFLTILNRYWVGLVFGKLRSRAELPAMRSKFAYAHRIKACQLLLQEGQQVPLQQSCEDALLSSLIVSPRNEIWWQRLEERLIRSRRGVTQSLVAQILFATLAYLFTVVTAFNADLGDPTTALQIASGSLWIWLVSCHRKRKAPLVADISQDPDNHRLASSRHSIISYFYRACTQHRDRRLSIAARRFRPSEAGWIDKASGSERSTCAKRPEC